MEAVNLQMRRAKTLEDYEACVRIQQEVWNFTHAHDHASVPLLRVQNRYGGSVLVAEDPNGQIQGFAYALLCRDEGGVVFWWSHMTAVRELLQGTGIGFGLKRCQRSEALRKGISEIRWTFDPLQVMNAHFNVRKLGAVAGSYCNNLYGISSSPLHYRLPTDRLEACWDLESDRVADRIDGTASVILRDFDGMVRVLESRDGEPGTPGLDHGETPLLVEIPVAYPAAQDSEVNSPAQRWQEALRATFACYLGQGYRVTDFILIGEPAPQAFYVLER